MISKTCKLNTNRYIFPAVALKVNTVFYLRIKSKPLQTCNHGAINKQICNCTIIFITLCNWNEEKKRLVENEIPDGLFNENM